MPLSDYDSRRRQWIVSDVVPSEIVDAGRAPQHLVVLQSLDEDAFGECLQVVWQIELCRRLGLPYLYLGYWIAQSRKMAYKINFQPLEGLIDGQWRRLARDASPPEAV